MRTRAVSIDCSDKCYNFIQDYISIHAVFHRIRNDLGADCRGDRFWFVVFEETVDTFKVMFMKNVNFAFLVAIHLGSVKMAEL